MPLIDLIDTVVELVSCGGEALPDRDKPKDPFLRLFMYFVAAAFFVAAIAVIVSYIGWW